MNIVKMDKIIETVESYREENVNPRTGKKYSQNELAVMMGLSEGIISQWKMGKRKAGVKSLEKLCKFLNRNVGEFFVADDGGEGKGEKKIPTVFPESIQKHEDTVGKFFKILLSKKEKEIRIMALFINYLYDVLK